MKAFPQPFVLRFQRLDPRPCPHQRKRFQLFAVAVADADGAGRACGECLMDLLAIRNFGLMGQISALQHCQRQLNILLGRVDRVATFADHLCAKFVSVAISTRSVNVEHGRKFDVRQALRMQQVQAFGLYQFLRFGERVHIKSTDEELYFLWNFKLSQRSVQIVCTLPLLVVRLAVLRQPPHQRGR